MGLGVVQGLGRRRVAGLIVGSVILLLNRLLSFEWVGHVKLGLGLSLGDGPNLVPRLGLDWLEGLGDPEDVNG